MAKTIITAALPYANGLIHIGHIIEYVQADIYARFLRLIGEEVLFICASDMHGTPIEVKAQQAGIKPKEFAKKYHLLNKAVFKKYGMSFDNYYHTDSKENKELASSFFNTLNQKGYIYKKDMKVVFCPNCGRNLPDRYVKGTCPNCGGYDQYGDVCENCGLTLKGTDLVNPRCAICQKVPIFQLSENYFFSLSKFASELTNWLSQTELQLEIKNSIQEWLTKGLEDWCISRDGPYFGFEIPNSIAETGEKKYFYVWLDAPIGYISSTKNLTDKHKTTWEAYWKKGEIYHFIGKDISYFHFLFWPAMLMAMDIPLPKLTVHGFITVNGQKMSKSRGTFFTAKDFIKLYPAESLRFYYASHLDRKVVDVDLDFENFKAVNNKVLVGSLSNFCYRVLTFAQKNYTTIDQIAKEPELTAKVKSLLDLVKESYQQQDFKGAVHHILEIADIGNAYFQQAEPWKDINKSKKQVGWCVNLTRNLAIISQPILPLFSHKIAKSFGDSSFLWKDIKFTWKGKLKEVELLGVKIEKTPNAAKFPLRMVVGKILRVENHPDADSLYLLTVDLGPELGKKQVVAGLKKYLSINQLQNQKALFCANMKPAKIRSQMSEAMIFAADDGTSAALLEASKSPVGMEAHFGGMENAASEVTFDEFKKISMRVKSGKVFYENQKLATKVEDIQVKGLKDNS